MVKSLFTRQYGKQEIEISLMAINYDGMHLLYDFIIDHATISGGEWVHSIEHNGEILRLSISSQSGNYLEGISMERDNLYQDTEYPYVDSFYDPHRSNNNLFSMSNLK